MSTAAKEVTFGHGPRTWLWLLGLACAGLMLGIDVWAYYGKTFMAIVPLPFMLVHPFGFSFLLLKSGRRKAAVLTVVIGLLLFGVQFIYGCSLEIFRP
jgi:hypothetical protein